MLGCLLSVSTEGMNEKRLYSQQPADLLGLVKEMVNWMRGWGGREDLIQ